ncbi:MAG: proteasome assembly chaperone 4 family protein [Candidatus Sigynarchaeota archaeon]
MPLGEIYEHQASIGPITFFYHAIRLRNAYVVLVTDDASGAPGLGNMAIAAPTRLAEAPVVSSALPLTNFKYEVIAKTTSELLSKKLKSPVFLFLDVHFESTDARIVKALKVGSDELCVAILAKQQKV